MSTPTIDLDAARRILKVADQGLTSGLGLPEPGLTCAEGAIAIALGLPFSDEPVCTHRCALPITLNDSSWSSEKARAEGMRPLLVMQLGTAQWNIEQERSFASAVALGTVRRVLPQALDAVGLEDHANKCRKVESLKAAVEVTNRATPAFEQRNSEFLRSPVKSAARAVLYATKKGSGLTRATIEAGFTAQAAHRICRDPSSSSPDKLLLDAVAVWVAAFRKVGSTGVKLWDRIVVEESQAT